ncbi:MAG TPA: hypothetical protein PK530_00650 [Anaerolineales bacterium]|nr:hypothetical protein [Anaerolineales bacterium]
MDGKRIVPSREQILASGDALPQEWVPVPEFGAGCEVLVVGANAEERVVWYEKAQVDGKLDLRVAQGMALVIGVKEPKFEEADIPALLKLSGAAVGRIQDTWQRLSGLRDDSLLDARKNSSPIPTA